jgi:hypothetical protein
LGIVFFEATLVCAQKFVIFNLALDTGGGYLGIFVFTFGSECEAEFPSVWYGGVKEYALAVPEKNITVAQDGLSELPGG